MAVKPDQLDGVPLFDKLPGDVRAKFAVWVSELEVPAGQHLADEGEYAYDLFIIQDGTAEVTQDGKTVAELGPGEFFGEMGVLEKAPRNATVVAETPMKLLTLTSWDVKRLESKSPESMKELERVIEQRRKSS
ncbi:MAG: family transcriptional regulator, cyclic receptor protein [Thermoleophilaceae bacterium]|jgi:CRP-like cAMP-binding protein|nr:family transcriptional regulator, cyclic receptor protein [Thermoleophilaceae bacterium]